MAHAARWRGVRERQARGGGRLAWLAAAGASRPCFAGRGRS